MASTTEYHSGKFGAFMNLIIAMIRDNPALIDDVEMLKAQLKIAMPELKDRSHCPNCEASMKEYVYTFDAWDALLVNAMAKVIRDKVRKGVPFTEANKVRIPELDAPHSVRCRTTKASKLGLVAAVTSGKRRVAGTWLITRRGWDALKGERVPMKVRVWRGRIEERFEETITMADALNSHLEYANKRIAKGKSLKEDHRHTVREYNPKEWYDFGLHEGKIF